MSHFATGVAIVTAQGGDGAPVGTTINAIRSLSLDPPYVLVCFDLASATLRGLRRHGAFAINVLADSHQALACGFARRGAEKPWDVATYDVGVTRGPRLHGVLATVECWVDDRFIGGDHEIVIGRVIDTDTSSPVTAPLGFYRGALTSLSNV